MLEPERVEFAEEAGGGGELLSDVMFTFGFELQTTLSLTCERL